MKINLFDKFVEFAHAKELGQDVLLFFVILRLKHARRPIWRVNGLHESRFRSRHRIYPMATSLYEGRPSEFVCQDESFSCSVFNCGQQYTSGLYFTSFLVTPTKFIAFLFTIEGSTVELKKYVVFNPSDVAVCWAKSYWSAYFWDEIELYHENKVSQSKELEGHRVLGKYMLFDDDEPSINQFISKRRMTDRLAKQFHAFPDRYLSCLMDLASVFAHVGVDVHACDSPVLFLSLSEKTINELKQIAQEIHEHKQHTLLLISNSSDIDSDLLKTGHCYDLTYMMTVSEYSYLYFYLAIKRR